MAERPGHRLGADRLLLAVGLLLGLTGVLIDRHLLGGSLVPGGAVAPSPGARALEAAQIFLVGWGLATIVFRRRRAVLNANLALLSLLIVSPVLGELFLRVAIHLEVPAFRNPRLYAGWEDDEDQWKLRYLWQSETRSALQSVGLVVDPLLGWAPRKSPENPLGVLAEGPYTPDFAARTALFYGDSFVYGVDPTPLDLRLPQQLDELLSDCTVYNYGVSGYGVDQVFLRFRETHRQFHDPLIVIGLLTLDLDRSIFRVRDAPKPYFAIEDDRLVLRGVPVPEDTSRWYQDHPPGIRSYFLAMVSRHLRLMAGGFRETEIPYRQREKKRINTRILEDMVKEARTHRRRLLFVLLYPEWELHYQGWREAYLKRLFRRLEVPFVDTKEPLLAAARDASGRLRESPLGLVYYPPPNNHLNELGNRLVAQATARSLGGRCGGH